MEAKNVTEIYSQLAKGTFLEQDRTSNFPGESIKSWETYCEASLDLSNQDDVGEEQDDLVQWYASGYKQGFRNAANKTIELIQNFVDEYENPSAKAIPPGSKQ